MVELWTKDRIGGRKETVSKHSLKEKSPGDEILHIKVKIGEYAVVRYDWKDRTSDVYYPWSEVLEFELEVNEK